MDFTFIRQRQHWKRLAAGFIVFFVAIIGLVLFPPASKDYLLSSLRRRGSGSTATATEDGGLLECRRGERPVRKVAIVG